MVSRIFTAIIEGLGFALITILAIPIFGFLPDFDHVLVLLVQGKEITIDTIATEAGRPLHVVGLVLVVFITNLVFARASRLWNKRNN